MTGELHCGQGPGVMSLNESLSRPSNAWPAELNDSAGWELRSCQTFTPKVIYDGGDLTAPS